MKERPVEELAARSSHGVSAASLSNMLKKFKLRAPAYYGLFPLDSDLTPLIAKNVLTQEQKTPPHVTAFYVGGTRAKDLAPNHELLNCVVDLTIIEYSVSDAGQRFVTKSVVPGNHITLSTNKGFKPVVVKAAYLSFY